MKTDDLIAALAADDRLDPPRLGVRALAGVAVSLVLLLVFWHLRPDLAEALRQPSVLAKLLLPLSVAALLAALWPQPGTAPRLWPLAIPAGMALGLFVASLPGDSPVAAILGQTWLSCLVSVPLLSAPIGLGLLVALRRTIVPDPASSGLLAGLLAGALGTAIYALHCDEDAAAFYAVWYSAGIVISGALGRFAGQRWLGV